MILTQAIVETATTWLNRNVSSFYDAGGVLCPL